jgi:hypothetical protein
VNSTVTSDIIAGIGADRVWAHIRLILWSIKTLVDAADVDGGLRTATGTSKCTPPLHLHSRTQSLSELDFWIQEVEVLTNSTSCISTTCRHPLVTIFHIPGYQTMKFLLGVLLWSPARGSRATMIIAIVFSIIEGMQVLGAARAKCVIERWRSQIGTHYDHDSVQPSNSAKRTH